MNATETALAELKQGLTLMLETMQAMNIRLEHIEGTNERILAACTAEAPPSQLVEPLQRLAESVQGTTAALRELTDAVTDLPGQTRQAIREELAGEPHGC